MKRRKRRRSEDIAKGYLLGVAHATILLHEAGWGAKKRLPEFAERMVDLFDQWQSGSHGYKETIDRLEKLTGLSIEERNEMTVESYNDRVVVINDEEIVGIYKSMRGACDAAHRWSRKLWNWESLHDVEQRAKYSIEPRKDYSV